MAEDRAVPARWPFPQSYSRLLDPIPSVPELQAYVDALVSASGFVAASQYREAVQALQDARWRLACESWRWCRRVEPWGAEGEYFWWLLLTAIAARRFAFESNRRYCPGKALMLRTGAPC